MCTPKNININIRGTSLNQLKNTFFSHRVFGNVVFFFDIHLYNTVFLLAEAAEVWCGNLLKLDWIEIGLVCGLEFGLGQKK